MGALGIWLELRFSKSHLIWPLKRTMTCIIYGLPGRLFVHSDVHIGPEDDVMHI